uniref:Uncharacterized protein n=1 Tax=viral metagenome TaxID=1070528 RepID=A0A6C0HFB0_9ZZZZ
MEVPSSLFESFEYALRQEAKRICRDAAKILNLPEKDVEEKVLKSMPKSKLTVIKDNELSYSCPIFMCEKGLTHRCRLPCILGTNRCYKHQTIDYIPEPLEDQVTLTRIQTTKDSLESLWCNELDGSIYNEHSECVGTYKNRKLILYSFEIT